MENEEIEKEEENKNNNNFDIIRNKIWNGKITLKIKISDTDKLNIPKEINYEPEFYINVQRCSYLPMYSEIYDYYIKRNIIQNDNNIWFSYNNISLKWHYPIGLLYDIMVNDSNKSLPWCIDIHFSDFPTNKLIRNPAIDTLKYIYFTTLKESDYLRYGNANRVMCLSLEDQCNMWDYLNKGIFKGFWEINSKLIDEAPWSNIALRIYYMDDIIQDRVEVGENEKLSINEVIMKLLNNDSSENENENENIYSIYSHGINIPRNTPVLWLAKNMSYPDNWLHIIIKKTKNN